MCDTYTIMAEHFKYFPSDETVVTPWNAQYSYPSQANKATKMTPRIAPKNGTNFAPGQQCRLEFPAQGYVNPLNTMLEFDVVLIAPANTGCYAIRFQNNIQCIFNRIRLLYGAQSQEDLLEYGLLVRFLTETTSTGQNNNMNQMCISDGIGGTSTGSVFNQYSASLIPTAATSDGTSITITVATNGLTFVPGQEIFLAGVTTPGFTLSGVPFMVTSSTSTLVVFAAPGVPSGATITIASGAIAVPTVNAFGLLNTRQAYIQGIEDNFSAAVQSPTFEDGWVLTNGSGSGYVPNNNQPGNLPGGINVPATVYTVRRYMVNFALGMFTQDKLIPTKYMASQLAIEITFASPENCIYQPIGVANNTTNPTYMVGNVNLIPEIIEFDDAYDNEFLKGLEGGGVPIKFSTWNYFQFNTQGSSSLSLNITEKSRSVKGIIALQRRTTGAFQYDSHACLFDSCTASNSSVKGSTMKEFQFRIGGRYFPAAPVQLSLNSQTTTNGGAEAYSELAKFLNIVGDARLSTNIIPLSWAVPAITNYTVNLLPEYDYSYSIVAYDTNGTPKYVSKENAFSAYCGNAPSSMYACAINFETSNGIEISGLNAEEQSDIAFTVKWSNSQSTQFSIEIFTFVDRMWVLRPNNYIDLVQ